MASPRLIRWLAPVPVFAGAVAVAWWIPTTGTAVSCGARGCIVAFHHDSDRIAILVLGALVSWIVFRAATTIEPRERGSIVLASLAVLVVGTALMVAIRFPAGWRPVDQKGISTDAWFAFRVVLAGAGITTLIAVVLSLWARGAAGSPGLRLLAFALPVICGLAAIVVPQRPTCPAGMLYPDRTTWSCVDVSRGVGPQISPTPAGTQAQWLARLGFVIVGVATGWGLWLMADRLEHDQRAPVDQNSDATAAR